ncbi:Uma2 family endonuclease [Oscillatoria sp. CS-180]|uniref:Uma2 family endonuclease n=1 Tax=Oscillatoria sp. CS-180 TaxID=3021720 RepID=UPI00232C7B2D|nr:Uma2 family endonuclease [Oscillatoria sp. CS-180]MDB9529832.1 Uma2 family endonuclease [Oscillatoria sp. CS-180]
MSRFSKPLVSSNAAASVSSHRNTLPTMYDLPSEFPGEPGLPDEFHDLQPQLLSRTLSLANYSRDNWFTGTDLNVYYDEAHTLWHKRPDWFLAVDVPRLYDGNLRLSYVVWQEQQTPRVVVEFLSPRTEQDDLGRFYEERDQVKPPSSFPIGPEVPEVQDQPPSTVDVYEQYLRVPHYIVYSRYTQRLRYFKLTEGAYQEQALAATNPRIWLEDLSIGLGVWQGEFAGVPGEWLRWCDAVGDWLLTDTEAERIAKEQAQQQAELEGQRARAEQQAKEQAQRRADQLAARLRSLGIDPDA